MGSDAAPLAVDLYCGLGGWTDGLLAEGYRVVGFDIERHRYGEAQYPAQLVLQDVLTIHGSQFREAALIVASSPCQEFSFMAMPWGRAKRLAREYLDGVRDRGVLTALFDACFRIQREAIEAAGRFIPLVVENVCGAQKWVGRARWHYGSFYLWGDVPALMPITRRAIKGNGGPWFKDADTADGTYAPGNFRNNIEGKGRNPDGRRIERVSLGSGVPSGNTRDCHGNVDSDQQHARSIKNGGDWFGSGDNCSLQRRYGSKSKARKAASAHIARIPFPLARHIARAWHP